MRAAVVTLLSLVLTASLFAQTAAAPSVAAPAPLPEPAGPAAATKGRAAQQTTTRELVPNTVTNLQATTTSGSESSEVQWVENGTTRTRLISNGSAVSDGTFNNGFKLWHIPNGPMAFATNNTERMRIMPDGKIGINTVGPQGNAEARFSVIDFNAVGTAISSVLWLTSDNPGVTSRAGINAGYSGVANQGTLIGMNTSAWSRGTGTLFQAIGNEVGVGVCCGGTGAVTNAIGTYVSVFGTPSNITNGYGVYIQDVPAANGYGVFQIGTNDVNFFGGSVGIGSTPTAGQKLEVTGNVKVNGDLTATKVLNAVYGQDIAEWVPATTEMSFGTVVVLNTASRNEVMPSTHAYDTKVAGVVSEQPGITLGAAGKGRAPIATSGRVKVHVDATAAPIHIGDLLVSGNKPGTAMKSIPVNVSGIEMHRPGTLIGKALEPLESGEGDILVLLSLQ